jgi:hypothetical protein
MACEEMRLTRSPPLPPIAPAAALERRFQRGRPLIHAQYHDHVRDAWLGQPAARQAPHLPKEKEVPQRSLRPLVPAAPPSRGRQVQARRGSVVRRQSQTFGGDRNEDLLAVV